MADLSDVEQAIVAILTQTIYPTGTGNPSVVGAGCKIYRGWPVPAALDADLNAGLVTVSVFPQDNEQKTTRYPNTWQELPAPTSTLTVQVAGNTITLSGTPATPLNVAAFVNGKAYVYPVQPSDTLVAIATGLAALISVDTPATSSGATVTVGGGGAIPAPAMQLSESGSLSRRFGGVLLESLAGFWPIKAMNMAITGLGKRFGGAILASMAAYWPTSSVGITARVGVVGSVIREIKRQKRGFQITFWCPTVSLRDAIASDCDVVLANTNYLSLADGTLGRLIYVRSMVSDRVEREGLYRRDLIYSVEYATTQTMNAPTVLVQKFNISGGLDPSAPAIETFFR